VSQGTRRRLARWVRRRRGAKTAAADCRATRNSRMHLVGWSSSKSARAATWSTRSPNTPTPAGRAWGGAGDAASGMSCSAGARPDVWGPTVGPAARASEADANSQPRADTTSTWRTRSGVVTRAKLRKHRMPPRTSHPTVVSSSTLSKTQRTKPPSARRRPPPTRAAKRAPGSDLPRLHTRQLCLESAHTKFCAPPWSQAGMGGAVHRWCFLALRLSTQRLV